MKKKLIDVVQKRGFVEPFVDNLLDRGETLIINVPGNSGFGFSNPSTTPLGARSTICSAAEMRRGPPRAPVTRRG